MHTFFSASGYSWAFEVPSWLVLAVFVGGSLIVVSVVGFLVFISLRKRS